MSRSLVFMLKNLRVILHIGLAFAFGSSFFVVITIGIYWGHYLDFTFWGEFRTSDLDHKLT